MLPIHPPQKIILLYIQQCRTYFHANSHVPARINWGEPQLKKKCPPYQIMSCIVRPKQAQHIEVFSRGISLLLWLFQKWQRLRTTQDNKAAAVQYRRKLSCWLKLQPLSSYQIIIKKKCFYPFHWGYLFCYRQIFTLSFFRVICLVSGRVCMCVLFENRLICTSNLHKWHEHDLCISGWAEQWVHSILKRWHISESRRLSLVTAAYWDDFPPRGINKYTRLYLVYP